MSNMLGTMRLRLGDSRFSRTPSLSSDSSLLGKRMRYFRLASEGFHAGENWGQAMYWLEVNDRGDAERELQVYPNGNVLRYDREHAEDEYGALAIMVIDGDEDVWVPHEITKDEFEVQWGSQARVVRRAESRPPEDPADG